MLRQDEASRKCNCISSTSLGDLKSTPRLRMARAETQTCSAAPDIKFVKSELR